MNEKTKIPVTIITGFLGAGKTTFINNLLQKYPEIQFALVENEFGDVAIDTKLIKGVDASQMFELKQGCICCTITDEYELVLAELAERFPNVEHLLIETTGVADPSPVIQPFFRDENLKEFYSYNGTICLLDALNFDSQPEKQITLKQLATADLVLINKTENFSEHQKEKLLVEIQNNSPFSEILLVQFGDSSNINLDNIQSKEQNKFTIIRTPQAHSQIQTKTLLFEKPLNKKEFIRWLTYTLDVNKSQVYRTKGILCFENEPYEYIFQGVGGSFELTEGEFVISETNSKIVFIGKLDNVDLDYIPNSNL